MKLLPNLLSYSSSLTRSPRAVAQWLRWVSTRLAKIESTVFSRRNEHYWHARDLADSALQVAITRCNNVALVLGDSRNNAVVCVGALV